MLNRNKFVFYTLLFCAETMLNAVTEMQQDFPQRKQAYDAELGELDQQIQSLNNLLGRCARRPSQLLLQQFASTST